MFERRRRPPNSYRPIRRTVILTKRIIISSNCPLSDLIGRRLTTNNIIAIYCLLLFSSIAFALPHQTSSSSSSSISDQEQLRRDATTDTLKVNLKHEKTIDQHNSSATWPLSNQNGAYSILNDDLHRSSINQSSSVTTTGTNQSPEASASELTTEGDDSANENTTLLIDYNQRTAYLTSSETPAASGPNELPDVTTTIVLAEPLLASATSEGEQHKSKREDINLSGARQAEEDQVGGNRQVESSLPQRDMRNARVGDKVQVNTSEIFATLFKKKPYSKYWSVEQKWDDIFKRFMAIQGTVKTMMMKNFLRDIEYYADVSISQKCADDLRYIRSYTSNSTNMRWLAHMFDSTGKSESGMLTGNLANLGHVIQCIKVRAPNKPSNDTFNERYFELQAAQLGERFRGKYCLASLRPVLPQRPRLVSRFSEILNSDLLSNISYMGEPFSSLKQRATQTTIDESVLNSIDRLHNRLDQIPFESELYEYLILSRNFVYSLPRFMGVCYPSSCSKDDIRYSIQKSVDEQHQVVDVEFECEVEEIDAWEWFTTPRLVIYLLLALVVSVSLGASLTRYILVDKLQVKRLLKSGKNKKLANLIAILDMLSMDKSAGILFIKTRRASPIIDKDKVENNRSTSIDALKGFLMLMLIYSELVHLGCLPVPFMWSKWSDAMFPFFRSYFTQIFLNTSIWTEAFYIISGYLISLKFLENYNQPSTSSTTGDVTKDDSKANQAMPRFSSFLMKRYIRLLLPTIAFIIFAYVWPRLSNGFVMQDQAGKILAPCDNHGWTNLLLFHNHYPMNETCLWPTHVSASFFQLHLLSYPILMLLLLSLKQGNDDEDDHKSSSSSSSREKLQKLLAGVGLGVAIMLSLVGLIYSALQASGQELIVPFLIDYIDFDNYQRVIEWTVMPTHNHLTSYMAGILLAYLVVRSRVCRRRRRLSRKLRKSHLAEESQVNWRRHGGMYMQREGSLESVVSSSTTQELNMKPAFGMFNKHSDNKLVGASTASASTSISSSSTIINSGGYDDDRSREWWLYRVCLDIALISLMLISITASYFWNGLGQPMTPNQTFWYMILTKLGFIPTFTWFFYRHFATRRNSSNPWMITRFLVPIGRMSLMLFYVSWPVIWFDLLASLYQWHPSHYFVFEKYNEIASMALIISMFAYGAFEGTIKIIQYQNRAARQLKSREQQRSEDGHKAWGFESFFQPIDWDEHLTTSQAGVDQTMLSSSQVAAAAAAAAGSLDAQNKVPALHDQVTGFAAGVPSMAAHKTIGSLTPAGYRKRLSIADQYKLNAELRANYSFASIGLYESAGATDDLPSGQQSNASGSGAGDPLQVSPGQTDKQRHL